MPNSILRASWHKGVEGARANVLPGLVLQAFALSLVLSYSYVDAVQEALGQLVEFRQRTGLLYPMVATAVFGGVLPWFYLRLQPATRNRFSIVQGAALTVFWAYKGLEVDLFYQLLAATIGEGRDVATILQKTVLDQLVYCPVLAIPGTWFAYTWIENGFDRGVIVRRFRPSGWYAREVLPILLSNAVVWIPAVALIYLLPTPLQLPMQNIVLCFYTLLLAHLTRPAETEGTRSTN